MPGEPSKIRTAQPEPPLRLASGGFVARVPVPLSTLVARNRECSSVIELLRGGKRLVTLTGPGGVGKTRLAIEIAAEVALEFADGAAFVDLSAVREATHVLPVVATTLGIRRPESQPVLSKLIDTLHPRHLLLVLDNFEQVLEAAPVLNELLQSCPRLTALVTSRSVLRISGEWVVSVPPLDLPAVDLDGRLPATEALREVESIRLFVERSQAANPSFSATDRNLQLIAEICSRLDGLPLAIELAAARGALYSPRETLTQLQRRLPLLTSGARDLPERQRTMRDAIAWSYDLLAPVEQEVFRGLSIFAGGCTLEAAAAVCSEHLVAKGSFSTRFGEIIEALLGHSLIQLTHSYTDEEAPPRLTMLETVREFAAEMLAATGFDEVARHHMTYFQTLAVATEQTFWGDAPGHTRARFLDEIANVRAALSWATEHGEPDSALTLARSMFDPYWVFDPLWRTGDNARDLLAWIQRTLAIPGGNPRNRIATLIGAAALTESQGDLAVAGAMVDEALTLSRHHGDELGLATASLLRGRTCFREGKLPEAERWLTDALNGFRAQGTNGRAAWAMCFLASIYSRQAIDEGGDAAALAHASDLCQQALDTFLTVDYPPGITRARHTLAQVAYKQRDLRRALALTQALLAQDWANQRSINNYLDDIADISGRAGQPAIAARLYGAADKERTRHGEPVTPVFRAEYERDRAVARDAIGKVAFLSAWQDGNAVPTAQAVAEALALCLPQSDPSVDFLTAREREILPLMAAGKTAKEIAAALFLSHRTVENHVANLRAKLGARTRAEVVEAALSLGLIPGESGDELSSDRPAKRVVKSRETE